MKKWPVPTTNHTALLSFLGFAGYYRRFIQGFARIAGPLHDLIVKGNSHHKKALTPQNCGASDISGRLMSSSYSGVC